MPIKRKLLGGAMALVVMVLSACSPEFLEPDLDATYNARQCIIDRESRNAGMYTAENSVSTASGAYQWLDSSWSTYLPWAEEHYGVRLTSPDEDMYGARRHAAYASPYAQDVVAAYALKVRPQGIRPWPYSSCWALIDSTKLVRMDGPENPPPLFVQEQIDRYRELERDG